MNDVLNIYKPLGLSSLAAVNLFKSKNPSYKDAKMTFAGRLDPMAEGILVVLVGDNVHEKDNYLGLDKEYSAEILVGFETDSYDVLGLPNRGREITIDTETAKGAIRGFEGLFTPQFPGYSSYKIKGKPLYKWAREGKLDELEIPNQNGEIYSIDDIELGTISEEELRENINKKLTTVQGDFRQDEIKAAWRKLLNTPAKKHQIIKLRLHVKSGTYIRSLAHELGKKLDGSAILYSLVRARVGKFKSEAANFIH